MDDVCYYLVNLSWCNITFFKLFLFCSKEPFLVFLTFFEVFLSRLGFEFSELSLDLDIFGRCAKSVVFYD